MDLTVELYAIDHSSNDERKWRGRIALPRFFQLKDLPKVRDAVTERWQGLRQINLTGAGLEIIAPDHHELTTRQADEILMFARAEADKINS